MHLSSLIPRHVVGIEWHDHAAQLVLLKRRGERISLEAYHRLDIPRGVISDGEIQKPEELRALLRDLLEHANPKAITSKRVAILMPESKTFTHIFTFPSTLKDRDIEASLPHEAETVFPVDKDGIYWDFERIGEVKGKNGDAVQRVLFAGVNKEVADSYVVLLESLGLQPYLFVPHVNTIRHAMLNQIRHLKEVLIVEFGSLSTNYMLLKRGRLSSFYSSNDAAADLPEGDSVETAEFLTRRFKRTEQILKKLKSKNQVVITGEYLNLPNIMAVAEKVLPQHDVMIGDPKIGIHVAAEKFLPMQKQSGDPIPHSTHFTNAIGVALQTLRVDGKRAINLLPTQMKQAFSRHRRDMLMASVAILMCVSGLVLAGLTVFLHQSLSYDRLILERQKSSVEKKIYGTRYQEIHAAITTFNNEVGTLHRIDQALFSLPDFLTDLEGTIPDGVQINAILFDDEALRIQITGVATDRTNLLALQNNLEAMPSVRELNFPISNFDQKSNLPFSVQVFLIFSELPPYANLTELN